jgi:hypothetical protein
MLLFSPLPCRVTRPALLEPLALDQQSVPSLPPQRGNQATVGLHARLRRWFGIKQREQPPSSPLGSGFSDALDSPRSVFSAFGNQILDDHTDCPNCAIQGPAHFDPSDSDVWADSRVAIARLNAGCEDCDKVLRARHNRNSQDFLHEDTQPVKRGRTPVHVVPFRVGQAVARGYQRCCNVVASACKFGASACNLGKVLSKEISAVSKEVSTALVDDLLSPEMDIPPHLRNVKKTVDKRPDTTTTTTTAAGRKTSPSTKHSARGRTVAADKATHQVAVRDQGAARVSQRKPKSERTGGNKNPRPVWDVLCLVPTSKPSKQSPPQPRATSTPVLPPPPMHHWEDIRLQDGGILIRRVPTPVWREREARKLAEAEARRRTKELKALEVQRWVEEKRAQAERRAREADARREESRRRKAAAEARAARVDIMRAPPREAYPQARLGRSMREEALQRFRVGMGWHIRWRAGECETFEELENVCVKDYRDAKMAQRRQEEEEEEVKRERVPSVKRKRGPGMVSDSLATPMPFHTSGPAAWR